MHSIAGAAPDKSDDWIQTSDLLLPNQELRSRGDFIKPIFIST